MLILKPKKKKQSSISIRSIDLYNYVPRTENGFLCAPEKNLDKIQNRKIKLRLTKPNQTKKKQFLFTILQIETNRKEK